MAVYRVERTKDYTVMSNHHLKDTALSLKAKGLLSLMLSTQSAQWVEPALFALDRDSLQGPLGFLRGFLLTFVNDHCQVLLGVQQRGFA